MNINEPSAPGSFRLPRTSHASVADAIHPGLISCPSDTPLRDVARIISTKHIHCLVVTSAAGQPARWSLISGLDLMAAAADGLEDRTAADIATSQPITVSTDDRLDRAAQLMIEHHVEHLLAVADGQPVGVLSTLDIAGVMAWGEA